MQPLRERLTEREDKPRPERSWTTEIGGRVLTLSGEVNADANMLQRRVVGPSASERDRVLLEHGLDAEMFYSLGAPLSLFAQVRVGMEEDLLRNRLDDASDVYVERGEMWLFSEDVFETGLDVDGGRIDFEDDRRWWWDGELDGVRLAYEGDELEIAFAVARELAPVRSDRSHVEPEHDRVVRLIGETIWDWHENHALELFALHANDRSPTERAGDVLQREREDDSDARLTWLGARWTGALVLPFRGALGYWLDTAVVRGNERIAEFEDLPGERSQVDEVRRRSVRGWAFDTGLSLMLDRPFQPRLFAGYAVGSGDPSPEDGGDESFRQTGLHGNEAGFGGVERFAQYGVLLDPELSNLCVATLGAGISLFGSSSLDLVLHHYRQVERARELRDTGLEIELTGASRDVGHGVDLVLALEEWDRHELALILSGFRAGSAFGPHSGTWSTGAFLGTKIAF